jgi:hypothetical protein
MVVRRRGDDPPCSVGSPEFCGWKGGSGGSKKKFGGNWGSLALIPDDNLSVGNCLRYEGYKCDTREVVRSILLQEDFATVVEFMIPRMILSSSFGVLYSSR